jgi:hypothetical protein
VCLLVHLYMYQQQLAQPGVHWLQWAGLPHSIPIHLLLTWQGVLGTAWQAQALSMALADQVPVWVEVAWPRAWVWEAVLMQILTGNTTAGG